MLRVEWRHGLVTTVSGVGELDGKLGVEGEKRRKGVRVCWHGIQELPYPEF